MEEIIEKTKALSWNNPSSLVKPNRRRAQNIHIIHPLIRIGRRFISDMKIEDARPNRFVFTFTLIEDKGRVLG